MTATDTKTDIQTAAGLPEHQAGPSDPTKSLSKIIKEVISSDFDPQTIARLGLTENDIPTIKHISQSLEANPYAPEGSMTPERDTALQRAEDVLGKTTLAEMGSLGDDLNGLLAFSDSQPTTPFQKRVASIPLIGPRAMRILPGFKEQVRKSQTMAANIEKLREEVKAREDAMNVIGAECAHVRTLVMAASAEISVRAISHQIAYENVTKKIATLEEQYENLSDYERTNLQVLRSNQTQLATRISNFLTLYATMLLLVPRLINQQQACSMTASKLHNIHDLAGPILVFEGFMAKANTTTAQTIAFANKIDDTLNATIVKSAKQTRENAVAAAKSNQKLTITTETVEQAFNEIRETIKEISQIGRQSQEQIQNTENRLGNIQKKALPL